ncbi:hypothetical protein [Macrococcus animalis]|uniref:hypothetical protein n=1 Tax=Macrococcus animalis TaxID=3395467 RepID=UPI0039BE5692
MLKSRFQRVAWISLVIGAGYLGFALFELFYHQEIAEGLGDAAIAIIFFSLALIYFRKVKKTDCSIEVYEDINKHKKFVIQKDVSFYSQYLIFSVSGAFLGKYKPNITNIKSFMLANLENFVRAQPFEHKVEDVDGNIILYIDIKGTTNPTFIILDEDKNIIGKVKQQLLQSFLDYVFEIEIDNQKFVVQSDKLTREIRVDGLMNMNSMKVPLKLTETFKTLTPTVYIIEDDLSTNKGKMGLAISVIYSVLKE